jgi:hypothetical protein
MSKKEMKPNETITNSNVIRAKKTLNQCCRMRRKLEKEQKEILQMQMLLEACSTAKP